MELVTVYLNMSDMSCPAVYHMLRKNGFMFAGCLLSSRKGDYLILQDLKGIPMEWDKLVLSPGFREMADMLRRMNVVEGES